MKYKDYKINYNRKNNVNELELKSMNKIDIICGKKYGLPFEYLMTDIYSDCLSLNKMCYANCTAALFCLKKVIILDN